MTKEESELKSLLFFTLPKLWSYAYRLTRDDDIAAQLVEGAYSKWLNESAHPSRLRGVLVGVLSKITEAWLMKIKDSDRKLEARAPRLPDLTMVEELKNESAHESMRAGSVLRLIDELPQILRIVILLFYAVGLIYPEAAEDEGISTRHHQEIGRAHV